MNGSSFTRPILATAALAAVGAGLAVGTTSAQASALAAPTTDRASAVQSCTITVNRVFALDLQEDAGGAAARDEILIRLGDHSMVERSYFLGQNRNTNGDGSDVFVGTERVRLFERDPGGLDLLVERNVACQAAHRFTTLTDATGDAIYRFETTVVVNP